MMEFLRRTWEQIAGFFRRMPVPNRVALGSLSAALVAVLVLFLTMTTTDDKVPLVWETIDVVQAENVRKRLEEKGVPFDIRGGRIYVEPENRDALLMELYGEGVISGDDKSIYEWVFQQSFDETRGKRSLRWLVSRQNALAKMISSLDVVESAMVTLTNQPETLFENVERMNAAVRLKLKPGKVLDDSTVLGIAKWVAFSVQGMRPQDVAIMDTAGTMYEVPDPSSPALSTGSQMKATAAWEKYIEDRVRKLLAPQFGPKLALLARVKIDFKSLETEEHGPREPIEKTIKSETSTETSITKQGEPGVRGEVQGANALPLGGPTAGVAGSESSKNLRKSEIEQDYTIVDMRSQKPPGDVESLTLVITAPYERFVIRPDGTAPGWDREKGEVTDQALAEQQVKATIDLWKAKLAAGLDVPVKNVDFVPSYFDRMVTAPEPTRTEKVLGWLETNWMKIGLVLLSLIAVFLIWRVLRSAAPDEMEQELEKMRADLAASAPQEEEVVVPAGEERAVLMKEHIRDAVKRNPRTAALLLKRWIQKG